MSRKSRKPYNPQPKTRELSDWLLARIHEVPYQVPLRWCFYRLVQERGYTKQDYGSVKTTVATLRKEFWDEWGPWTLVDETRSIQWNSSGFNTFSDWLTEMKTQRPTYEKFTGQDEIVLVAYEAEAMTPQFEYYTEPYHVPLTAFKGDAVIYQKWQIAYNLARLYRDYGPKPVRILYFGDYEPLKKTGSRGKGLKIPFSAFKDIKPWFIFSCRTLGVDPYKDLDNPLDLERIGLNQEHIDQWHLPENPERAGEYQWEALSDAQARELIVGALDRHLKKDAIDEVKKQEQADHKRWCKIIEDGVATLASAQGTS